MDGARAERSPSLSKGTKDWRALRGRGWGLESDVAQPACRWEWALSTPTSCRGGPAAGAEGGGAGARSHSHPSALPHFHHPAALSARLQPPAGFGCTIKGAYPRFIAGLYPQGVTDARLWTLFGP